MKNIIYSELDAYTRTIYKIFTALANIDNGMTESNIDEVLDITHCIINTVDAIKFNPCIKKILSPHSTRSHDVMITVRYKTEKEQKGLS